MLSDTLAAERSQKFLRKLGKVISFRKDKLMRTKSRFGAIWRLPSYIPLKLRYTTPDTLPSQEGKLVSCSGVISNNLKTTESPSSWDCDSFISRSRLATSDGWSIVEGHLVAVDEAAGWPERMVQPLIFFKRWKK